MEGVCVGGLGAGRQCQRVRNLVAGSWAGLAESARAQQWCERRQSVLGACARREVPPRQRICAKHAPHDHGQQVLVALEQVKKAGVHAWRGGGGSIATSKQLLWEKAGRGRLSRSRRPVYTPVGDRRGGQRSRNGAVWTQRGLARATAPPPLPRPPGSGQARAQILPPGKTKAARGEGGRAVRAQIVSGLPTARAPAGREAARRRARRSCRLHNMCTHPPLPPHRS